MWLEKLAELEQERRGYLRLAAKGHMSDDDLAEALAELEDTRATAEMELKVIRGRKAALEKLERDRDALFESYAGMMPDALDSLAPEDRVRVYGMLRLNVEISAEGTMQARGVLGDDLCLLRGDSERLCEMGLTPACWSRNTKLPELGFHAVVGDGTRELRFERLLAR